MSRKTIENILNDFNLSDSQYEASPLTAGLINDTYLLTDAHGPQYILQKVNHNVFPEVPLLMENVGRALLHLKADDYEAVSFLPTAQGRPYLEKAGHYWRIMKYIPDSTTFNTTADPQIAFEAGRILGRFHALLDPANPTDFKDTLPQFHHLGRRKREFESALESADHKKKQTAEIAIQQARHLLHELQHLNNAELPLRVCHNDTKLNNILFLKTEAKALCLIDLDTLMTGYFYYDFGDALRTVVNTAPEDETDFSKICFDEGLFRAFVDGLATNPSFLTDAEKNSLPLGAVFMPFLHGLRALTDYLNNNIYYKVRYENQNLDRCLSLFHFAQKALGKREMMSAYIQEQLLLKIQ